MSGTKKLFESFQNNLNENEGMKVISSTIENLGGGTMAVFGELANGQFFAGNEDGIHLYNIDVRPLHVGEADLDMEDDEDFGEALDRELEKHYITSYDNFSDEFKTIIKQTKFFDEDEINQLINDEILDDEKQFTESEELTEAKTPLIKTYNETDGGYKNNATSVYGELVDGNYYHFVPDNDYLGIFDAPVEDIIYDIYNNEDEEGSKYETFAAEHEIINYPNKEALYRELDNRYFGNDEEELEEASLSRLYQHTKDKDTFAIIGSQDQTTREDRSKELLGKVKNVSSKYPKIGFNKLEGTYTYEDGTQGIENSLIIYNIPKDEALNIADELNQESIIWKDGDFFGFLKPDGQVDGTFDNQDKNMSFDDKITSMYGSKLKGNNNSSKPFVFECCLVETDNIGSDFSKQNKTQIKKYPICKIEESAESDDLDKWWSENYNRAIDFVDAAGPDYIADLIYDGDTDWYYNQTAKHVAIDLLHILGIEEFEEEINNLEDLESEEE